MQDAVIGTPTPPKRVPWNKGKLTGAKPSLRPEHVWAIRTKLQIEGRVRDLAMFNLAIDSKLRACDPVKLKVRDIAHGDRVGTGATVMQQKTQRPVQFEISPTTREALEAWIRKAACICSTGGASNPHPTNGSKRSVIL